MRTGFDESGNTSAKAPKAGPKKKDSEIEAFPWWIIGGAVITVSYIGLRQIGGTVVAGVSFARGFFLAWGRRSR